MHGPSLFNSCGLLIMCTHRKNNVNIWFDTDMQCPFTILVHGCMAVGMGMV